MKTLNLAVFGAIAGLLAVGGEAAAQYYPSAYPTYPNVVTSNNVPYSAYVGQPQSTPYAMPNTFPGSAAQPQQRRTASATKNISQAGKRYVKIGATYSMSDSALSGACNPEVFGNCSSSGDMGSGNTISIGVGFYLTPKMRFDVSYNRLSGISYGDTASWIEDDRFEYDMYTDYADYDVSLPVSGGEVISDYVMITGYYDITDYFASLKKSKFKPYVGFGIGYAFNEIKDTTIDSYGTDTEEWGIYTTDTLAPEGFVYNDLNDNDGYDDGEGVIDGDHMMTYLGATTKGVAWQIMAGVNYRMSSTVSLDLMLRYANLGKIKTGSTVIDSYAEYYYLDTDTDPDADGYGFLDTEDGATSDTYDEYMPVTPESGKLQLMEIGVSVNVNF